MELLAPPKSMQLLDVGLETLHEQSFEWLNEIDFWRDEVAFFYSLLVEKTLKSVPINSRDTIENIENEILSISDGELDELQHAVEEHEKFLSHLLESNYDGEETYREKHRQLDYEFMNFKKRFKSLNKNVLSLLKQIKKT